MARKTTRTMAAARWMVKNTATGEVAFLMARYGVGRTTAKHVYSQQMNRVPHGRRPVMPVAAAREVAVGTLVAGFKAW